MLFCLSTPILIYFCIIFWSGVSVFFRLPLHQLLPRCNGFSCHLIYVISSFHPMQPYLNVMRKVHTAHAWNDLMLTNNTHTEGCATRNRMLWNDVKCNIFHFLLPHPILEIRRRASNMLRLCHNTASPRLIPTGGSEYLCHVWKMKLKCFPLISGS